jgi:hypothetical protein
MNYPLWATPARQTFLVRLFHNGHGACIYGHPDCEVADHYYEFYSEMVIDLWKAQDREERAEAWTLEKKWLHPRFRFFRRGPWDTIRREEFLASRPIWSIEAIGVGAFTFQRVVKVEIPALKKVVWVNLPQPAGMGKNAKHKLVRYGKGKLPEELEPTMVSLVMNAVAKAIGN